ncbi:GNAT family N-acetyltransferase [Halosquirtibacter xylanolyticus]|nr:GNAT family N-acetyltransferase [Prolixibacteraceae bacterium]
MIDEDADLKKLSVIVRKVSLNDIEELKVIGQLTFQETYGWYNSEENMIEYLDQEFSREKLRAQLLNENSEFYFTESDDKVIGYLKVNVKDAQTEMKLDNALEIERIYVLKEYHGKSVGKILYDKAIELARQKEVESVWLGVWEKNPRAIKFYEKNGLTVFDKHVFKLGDDEQTDIMMKLEMKSLQG